MPPERLDRLATSYGGNVKNRWARSTRWCENMVAILMTQRAAFPLSWGVYLDFWTSAYEAIDD